MPESGTEDEKGGTPLAYACPRCGQGMEVGFLAVDRARTSWLRERPEHWWQGDFSDHVLPSGARAVAICPAARCLACGLVLFQHPLE